MRDITDELIEELEQFIDEMTQKRIRNPQTGKYYQIRQKNTSKGKKGQIMGKWHKKFGNVIKKLSQE